MIYGLFSVTAMLSGLIFTVVGWFFWKQAGVWSISGKVDTTGNAIQPSAADVNTIKGWMTLEQVSTTFNVPVADILSAFNLSADTPPSTAMKDLESETFDITLLRAWLLERQTKP